MKLENWTPKPDEPNGVVAEFAVRLPHLTVEGLTLCRRRQSHADAMLRIPKNAYNGDRVCRFSDTMYGMILRAAVDEHHRRTGERLWLKGDEPAVEDDAAGLRRVIGETMERAGL